MNDRGWTAGPEGPPRLRHLARRTPRRLALAAAAAVLWLVGAAAPALAHATLENTTPQQGSQVSSSPASVSLHFSEGVGINSRSLEVLDPSGHRVDRGNPHHPAGESSMVTVDLPPGLPRASYAVVWHVVSADSHPVGGTFSFGVGVPAGATPAQAGGSPVIGWLDAGLRGLAYAGAVLLLGGTFFVTVLWPTGLTRPRPRRLITTGWVASVIAAAGLFLVQGSYGAGLGPGSLLDPALLGETLSTRYGKLMLLRLVVLACAVPLLRRLREAGEGGRQVGVDVAGLGVVFVITFSMSQHSGTGSLVPLSATADAVHLAAACVWVGGLAVLVYALLGRAAGGELAAVLPRWSRTAMAAVAAIVITGTFQAWRNIGTLPALTGTDYGRLVLAKVGCLLVLLVLADLGRRWVRRHTPAPKQVRVLQPAGSVPGTDPPPGTAKTAAPEPTPAQVRRLRASVGAEVGIAVVVLALTTALVNAVPGRTAYAPPFSATVAAQGNNGDTITVLLDVDPTKAGPTTVHVYTYTTVGAVLPFAAVTGSMVERSKDLGPVTFDFDDTGPGHGTAADVVVPSPGRWTLTVQVRTDATTDYAATTAYTVR